MLKELTKGRIFSKFSWVRYIQLHIFLSFLKDNDRLQQWSQSMQQTFKKSHFVCELHFKIEDVRDVIKIRGLPDVLKKEKVKLVTGVIPQPTCRKALREVQNVVHIIFNDQKYEVFINFDRFFLD